MRPWKIVKSAYLLRRPWVNVRCDSIITERGVELEEYHVFETNNWVCVLCLTKERRVVLVEQYRHGLRRCTTELPAGGIDPDESPLEAARRELREETGYEANRWVGLGAFSPEPTRHSHQAHLFVALDAHRAGDQQLDAAEDVRVRLADEAELAALIDGGELVHAVHVAATLKAERHGLVRLPPRQG